MSHPLLDQLDLNFRPLSHFEFASKVISIANAFAAHSEFQDPFPPTIPNAGELREIGNHHATISNEALTGDRGKIAARDAFRLKAEVNTAITVQWAVMRSIRENNPGLIANLGVEPQKRATTRSSHPPLVGAPVNLVVKHGPLSGIVLVSTKVQGAITYELEACQGDPTQEESWSAQGQYPGCRKMELRGLEPGKVYHFRVRCFGASGRGPWSSIVSLMVI